MPQTRPDPARQTTKGQVLALLSRGSGTVEDLAAAVGLTPNAVRSQLASLARDGLVRQEGVRRGTGAGKPAALYHLTPEADTRLSSAYAPLLVALVEEIGGRLPPADAREVFAAAGRRIAATMPRAVGTLRERAGAAAELLNSLGGITQLVPDGPGERIEGESCPLATAVTREPATCEAVRAMLGEVTGAPVRRECTYHPRPQCRFGIGDQGT